MPALARIAAIEARFGGAGPSARVGGGGTLGVRSAREERMAAQLQEAGSAAAGSSGVGSSGVGSSGVGSSGAGSPGSSSFAAALARADARVGGAAPTAGGSALDWSAPGDAVPPGTPFAELFTAAAQRAGLSPRLLAAVAHVESRFDTAAVSPAGAQGLMQFMPGTSAAMGVDPWDPSSAIDGAARLLAGHLARFGTIEAALAAYNLGSGTVARAGGTVPPQGRGYVDRVLRHATGGFA